MADGAAGSRGTGGQHSTGQIAPCSHSAARKLEKGSGAASTPEPAMAHTGDHAGGSLLRKGFGEAADTNVTGTGGGEMREMLPVDADNAAGRSDDSPPSGFGQHAKNSGDTGGQLGSAVDESGDRAPGTAHRAGQGARTGPTKGRGQRRLVAFLGGIDVCSGKALLGLRPCSGTCCAGPWSSLLQMVTRKAGSRCWRWCRAGRYDTRDHSLFRTLHTVHSKDFYSGCVPGADQESGGDAVAAPTSASPRQLFMHFIRAVELTAADASCAGPRQPWHDTHTRIEGPAAFDVRCCDLVCSAATIYVFGSDADYRFMAAGSSEFRAPLAAPGWCSATAVLRNVNNSREACRNWVAQIPNLCRCRHLQHRQRLCWTSGRLARQVSLCRGTWTIPRMRTSRLWTPKTVTRGGHRYIPDVPLRRRASCSAVGSVKRTDIAAICCDQALCPVQIFRSIDSECALDLCDAATNNAQAYDRGLVTSAAPALIMLAMFDAMLACLHE